MKKICIISEFYPYEGEPLFPFVQQLAYSLSNENVDCTVVAPQSITKNIIRHMAPKPVEITDISPDDKKIRVLRPYILTFSNTKNKALQWIADKFMERAIRRGVEAAGDIDAVYCYFWHVGLMTSIALKKLDVPIYVQASECELTIHPYMKTQQNLSRVKYVICASGKNRNESVAAELVDKENTTVIVNGYRTDEFYSIPKTTARAKLGISPEKFVVVFVGGFIERKGIRQLSNVLDRFDDVYSIFVGQGEEPPQCKNILFSGKVPHNQIVNYLNCGDIFVLPTRAEGCCNAIIEALACGLPVISSNKAFNDEILNDACLIRIDEQNEDELYKSISELKDNIVRRNEMAHAAIEKAKQLTIEHRAKAIKNVVFGDKAQSGSQFEKVEE